MNKIKMYLLPMLLLLVIATFVLSSLFMFYTSLIGLIPLLLLFGIGTSVLTKINKLLETTPHVQHVNMKQEQEQEKQTNNRKTLINVEVKDL